MFLTPGDFAVLYGCYYLCYASKKLKSANIAQINQLFHLLNLISANGDTNEQKCKQWRQQRFT